MPAIILEGNEASGKSTLSDEIIKTYKRIFPDGKIIFEHVGPPDKFDPEAQTVEEFSAQCRDRLLDFVIRYDVEDSNTLCLFDRFHIGAHVYGTLFRPESNREEFGDLGIDNFSIVEDALVERGFVTAFLNTPVATLIERSVGREDEYLDSVSVADDDKAKQLEKHNQLNRITYAYERVFSDHVELVPSYLGYPLYVGKANSLNFELPIIAFDTDPRNVANHLLSVAIERQGAEIDRRIDNNKELHALVNRDAQSQIDVLNAQLTLNQAYKSGDPIDIAHAEKGVNDAQEGLK